MMRNLRVLPVLAVLLFAAPASAQVSLWLQKGVSGFGFGAGVFRGKKFTTLTLGGGYSYQGWIDFDLDFGYRIFDEDTVGGALDIKEYALSPAVQVHPLKQSKTIPISLSISASALYSTFASDNFVDEEGGGTYGASLGVNVYRFFRLGESVGVIPAAGISAGIVQPYETMSDGTDVEDIDSLKPVSMSLGAYFAYIDSGGRVWGIVPQVSIPLNDDAGEDPVFGITVNLIFSQMVHDAAPPPPPPAYAPPPPPPQ